MTRTASIAEARNHLPALVHSAEAGQPIALTRRGKTVAVLLSFAEFERLRRGGVGDFCQAVEIRADEDLASLDLAGALTGVRDASPAARCPGDAALPRGHQCTGRAGQTAVERQIHGAGVGAPGRLRDRISDWARGVVRRGPLAVGCLPRGLAPVHARRRRPYPAHLGLVAAAAWHADVRAQRGQAGRPLAFDVGQIAAIAHVHGVVVVTTNVGDFAGLEGGVVENWSA